MPLIVRFGEDEYKDEWMIKPGKNNVAFGSAKDRWGFTLKMAEEKNITPSQLALAWIMAKGILPIPGTKRRKYVEQNINATQIELTSADLSRLESIVPLGTDTGEPYDEFSMGLLD